MDMRLVRSTGNGTTEGKLAFLMRAAGIKGYRRHARDVAGRPDFWFPGQGVAVFTDGCFWHGCQPHFRIPRRNPGFWIEKVMRNAARDVEVNRQLAMAGVIVIRVWEHDLRDESAQQAVADHLRWTLERGHHGRD